MNAYEFGQHIAALEKEAGARDKLLSGIIGAGTKAVKGLADDAVRGGKQLVNRGTSATRGYQRGMQQNVVDPLTIPLKDRYKAVPLTAKPTGPSRLDAAARAAQGQAASLYHGTPGRLAGQAVDAVGGLGRGTMNVMRRGLNKADDMVQGVRGLDPRAAGQRFGDQTVGRTQAAAKNLPEWMGGGSSAMTNARNPLNLAVGAGTGAAGMHYAGKAMGLGSEPTSENVDAQQMNTQMSMAQHAEANPNNGGLTGMWNSLPIEARYAIGAGVPLALAGAFMGGRGNTGLGAGMGALGLGAAGLGAAGAGMFGDGARRMVGQGANGLYSMLGGGGGNPMDQINALSQLSPEFGTTMLMGRDPNMSSGQGRQMYDFLTHNRNIIEQLMPQLQNASTNGMKQGSALEFGKAAGRCWTGYEPVPGKKPYSNDSCRPVGSKKKDKKEKKARSSAARGKTEMNCTPSARGSNKIIDDKQRSAPNPVPTDAANAQQSHGEKEAAGLVSGLIGAGAKGLGAMARGGGRAVAGGARAVSRATGAAAGELGNAAVNRGARMASGGAQQMMRGGVGNAVGGGIRAATGAGMYGAGQVARGAGSVARWAGTQVPGSTAMNAARTAVAMPIAAGATYGAYRATAPAVDPYISSAQQFGSDTANRVGAGLQQAGQAAMAVPRAIGQGVHDAGSAIGDAAGTAYGTARNTVVNTANDVRRGVTNAAQTARSYVPNVRNPFYYGPQSPQPNQAPAGGVEPLQSGRVSDLADL
jgi:hypothetical protein